MGVEAVMEAVQMGRVEVARERVEMGRESVADVLTEVYVEAILARVQAPLASQPVVAVKAAFAGSQ